MQCSIACRQNLQCTQDSDQNVQRGSSKHPWLRACTCPRIEAGHRRLKKRKRGPRKMGPRATARAARPLARLWQPLRGYLPCRPCLALLGSSAAHGDEAGCQVSGGSTGRAATGPFFAAAWPNDSKRGITIAYGGAVFREKASSSMTPVDNSGTFRRCFLRGIVRC